MGRRRNEKLLDVLIRLPWWASAIGVVVVLAARAAWLSWVDSSNDLGMFAGVVRQLHWWFYGLAVILALGSLASLIRQWWNGRLLNKHFGLCELRKIKPGHAPWEDSEPSKPTDAMHWRDFERILQEAFRRQGYLSVESPSGPDGGYDIALRKDGKRYLVQCKHWKSRQVGVAPVRELWGVIAASKADGGFFVTSGSFTPDAQAFARDINLELVDGTKLERLLAKVSSKPATTSERIEPKVPSSPDCPKCGREMVRRVAKKGANVGKEFWGCTRFPGCRGILS